MPVEDPSSGAAQPAATVSIVEFECGEDVSFEAFGTVFRALNGQYIRPNELVAHGQALDFFGINVSEVRVWRVGA